MSYKLDKSTGDIIIKGWEQGIADDPYAGISDIRNVNLISIPKESSVNFSTSKISAPNANGTMTTTSLGGDTITISTNIEPGQAIQFSVLSDTTKGISLNTTYWAVGSSGVYQLYSDYARANLVNITGDGVTGTWATINMATPKYFAVASRESVPSYWMVDSSGYVWSNAVPTNNAPFYWTYTGNKPNTFSNGNGLVYYSASDGTGYMFVFSNSSIDYTPTLTTNVSWVYQWNVAAGTVGSFNTSPTQRLKTSTSINNSHEAIVAPDNKVYFCDANWVGRWYQADPTIPFVPTTLATYVFDQTAVLPFIDIANCLAPLGNNLLIGGQKNVIYPWDTFSQLAQYPILVAENNIQKMVTVNTNTFALVGNRGRVYVTNGSQAQLYKKLPDHISGTVEPYYQWGGLTSNKNQIYFSALVTTNAGVANNNYGGVWAIDVDTKAIRLTNKLSYGTYAGYASAIIPNFVSTPAGTGLYIGWNSGASTYGIDTTVSAPYSGGETTIDSDLVPIGTFLNPTTNGKIEFKLAVPIVSGESVKLQYRQAFSDSFTDVSSTVLFTYGTSIAGGGTGWNGYAGVYQNVPFQNSQWVQLRAVLTSTASSPSYVRLTELRLGN